MTSIVFIVLSYESSNFWTLSLLSISDFVFAGGRLKVRVLPTTSSSLTLELRIVCRKSFFVGEKLRESFKFCDKIPLAVCSVCEKWWDFLTVFYWIKIFICLILIVSLESQKGQNFSFPFHHIILIKVLLHVSCSWRDLIIHLNLKSNLCFRKSESLSQGRNKQKEELKIAAFLRKIM